jgi:iron uptake system component EfeO
VNTRPRVCTCTAEPPSLAVSRGSCAAKWPSPHGGEQTLQFQNTDTVTMELDLVDPATGGVYAEIEALAAGTTRPMHVTLAKGDYAVRCVPDGAASPTTSTTT